MTDWLFKEDNYVPPKDKDKFVDKSILSILKVLSNLKRETFLEKRNTIELINPFIKLLFTLIIIIFISISRNISFIILVGFANLFIVFLMGKQNAKIFLSIGLFISLFTLIILAPSMVMGNINNSVLIVVKVFITIMTVNILSFSTKWNDLAKSLKLFFIPDIFILVLEITLRYIYILGEISMEMLYALKLRAIGYNKAKYASVAGIMGSLFLKSKDMGEEMYSAMECRGFTGEYTSKMYFKLGVSDYIYIVFNLIIITMYFIL